MNFTFVAGNNIVPGKVFSLVNLSPGSQYKLRVTAHNAAGSSVANYRFTTLTAIGGEFLQIKLCPCEILTNFLYSQAICCCHIVLVLLMSLNIFIFVYK
jgi:hypothetical protein